MNYHKSQFARRYLKVFLAAILGSAFLLILVPKTGADALTISPPVIEIDADPGAVIQEEIRIINTTDQPQIFYVSTADFAAGGEAGEPAFLSAEQDYPYSLIPWLTLSDKEIFLPSWERAQVKVTITIPQDASPGGHYGGVFFETRAPEITSEIGVGVVSKVGTLILTRVSGKVIEQANIIAFGTQTAKELFSKRPIAFYTRFENSGNVHLKPVGKVDIYNLLGRVVASLEVNENGGNVLPGSARRFEMIWKGKKAPGPVSEGLFRRFFQEIKNEARGFGFGKYSAYLSLSWGQDNKESSTTFEFWIFPWRLILTVVIILILIILVLTAGMKKYNQWILKKAGKSNS
ncbi:DUF916 domain-containing protein [Candidatus Parcubacteria bacterium]|nr:DUF916 domain-containing protein [Candidatus Parcubacteria bacterium]